MEKLYKDNFFPSEKRFYDILKENGYKLTHKEVKEFIEKQAVSQVHKPILKIKTKQKSIVASSPEEQLQIDILDYSKYKTSNRYYAWILLAIDIFTRKGYAVGIKSKSPNDLLNGFKKMDLNTFSVIHDDGKEFMGAFKNYLKANNISDIAINSNYHTSLGVIDRFSKTIKTTIEKNMTSNNNVNWFNSLDDIIENYNNSPHKGILDIKPNMAEENSKAISSLNFWKAVKNNELNDKEKINEDDLVRIKVIKSVLAKGYSITYSKKVYKVIELMNDGKVKLDDNKIYHSDDLKVVPKGSLSLGDKQKNAEERAKNKRRLGYV